MTNVKKNIQHEQSKVCKVHTAVYGKSIESYLYMLGYQDFDFFYKKEYPSPEMYAN
jgi:hypothetical protein